MKAEPNQHPRVNGQTAVADLERVGLRIARIARLNGSMKIVPTFVCPRDWLSMSGNEELRFCSKCGKQVYNLNALSLNQRFALLPSESNACGRYRVAIRRSRPGAEKAYMQHLSKYGAAVGVVSGVFLVLWQLAADHERIESRKTYRAVTPGLHWNYAMPDDLYEQSDVLLLGMIDIPKQEIMPQKEILPPEFPATPLPTHIDLEIDDSAIRPKRA